MLTPLRKGGGLCLPKHLTNISWPQHTSARATRNFHSLEVVDRVSETQLQMVKIQIYPHAPAARTSQRYVDPHPPHYIYNLNNIPWKKLLRVSVLLLI